MKVQELIDKLSTMDNVELTPSMIVNLISGGPIKETTEVVEEIKEIPTLGYFDTLNFGKYGKLTVRQVLLEDPAYIAWMADNIVRDLPAEAITLARKRIKKIKDAYDECDDTYW